VSFRSAQSEKFHAALGRFNDRLESGLYLFSAYALPIFIGLISLVALWLWQSQYAYSEPQPLEIQVLGDAANIQTPEQALEAVATLPLRGFHDTQLSQQPVWFGFKVPDAVDGLPLVIEFPSRHAMEITCWDMPASTPIVKGNRQSTQGALSVVRAGFAMELTPKLKGSQVICRTLAVGPARINVLKWKTADFQESAQEFHRKSGLLDGGIIVLAVFVLITALINRSGLYILFATWLVVNLRMGALSAGWDAQWLGNSVPDQWLLRIRLVTTAVYYVLTIALFKFLFREELTELKSIRLLRFAQWTCVPLLVLSAALSYKSYLPFLWVATGLSIGVLVFYLALILYKTRSRVAMWYAASIGITLLSSLSEVVAASLGMKGLIGSVNSVTAALTSSLLAALAIAQQMRQEHEQRLAVQAELAHTFEAMPIGLFTLDLRGRFISANPALVEMLGPQVLTPDGNAWQQHFKEGSWLELHQVAHTNAGTEGVEIEVLGRRLPGKIDTKRFLVKATLARDRIEGSLQDITEKSRVTEDLMFLANHDSLTKVLNRRGIEKCLNAAITIEAHPSVTMALAYLDLDRFKLINDLYGHAAGDAVLQQVCQRVSNMLTADIQFGRVGGDEFVLVFQASRISLAALLCRGIVESIGTQPYRVGDQAFHVRASIGLIEVVPGMQFNDAMSTADRACREAKAGSGEGLVVYERDAPAFRQHEAELKLIALLSTTDATRGLYVQMQPIMSLVTPHDSLNFEVLLRMRDADGKLVPTDRLITAGEASGRMGMIDRWVLSTTLAWLNTNAHALKTTRFVCMNLSGASLNDEKFLHDVFAMLEQNLHIVSKLCLEITESVALHDLDNTRRFVERVRSYGAKVALDDFGAGYTSFSYLKELTADLLKIDGSFIVDMNNHPANIAIVEAIVSLARNLGMKTIAEWAEDMATVQTLVEIGVDYVQGYAVARPQDPPRLLTAESSASFIQDEALARYVYLIGKSDQVAAQVDLFSEPRNSNLH
jgi:diguanylate cyclase (GGDEF)-like protein